MIADFGLSKQLTIEVASDSIAYTEPQCYKNDNYVKDKRSDIYSLGVLLWEITSGYTPFSKIPVYKITNGFRESPIIDTPLAYVNLYQKCWDDDPNLRPTIDNIFDVLEKFSLQFNPNDESNSEFSEYSDINSEATFDLIDQNGSQSQSSTNSIYEMSLSQIENQNSKLYIFT